MKEFNDLGTFITVFNSLDLAVQQHAERALGKAAKLIEDTAKGELGHYQPAVGPFPAWAPLADFTRQERERLGFTPDDPLFRDGTLIHDSIQHETRGPEAVIGSKEDVAAYQEFGTDKIPPRPFMGPAAYVNREKVERIFGKALFGGLIGGNALEIDYDSTE